MSSWWRGTILLLYALSCCSGCQKQRAPQPVVVDEPAFKRPTAAEVFDLRTKCAELAEKINREYDHAGLALSVSQGQGPTPLTQEHFSHYDSKSNRCYVELRVTPALGFLGTLSKGNAKALKIRDDFLASYELDYLERHLYDGQTGEELAYSQHGSKKVTASGTVNGVTVDWHEAYTRVDELMTDDRNR